jgi:hypothetical protein
MKSIIISRIRSFAIRKPTVVAFGLALAITLAVGPTMGVLDHQQALYSHIHIS